MRTLTALAIFLMSSTCAYAGKHDYFECIDDDGAVSYSVTKCPKGVKQKVIRSDEEPGVSVPAYVPPPAPAKPAGTPDQSGKKDTAPAPPPAK